MIHGRTPPERVCVWTRVLLLVVVHCSSLSWAPFYWTRAHANTHTHTLELNVQKSRRTLAIGLGPRCFVHSTLAGQLVLCFSKCGPWTTSVGSITHANQGPAQDCTVTVCHVTRRTSLQSVPPMVGKHWSCLFPFWSFISFCNLLVAP